MEIDLHMYKTLYDRGTFSHQARKIYCVIVEREGERNE